MKTFIGYSIPENATYAVKGLRYGIYFKVSFQWYFSADKEDHSKAIKVSEPSHGRNEVKELKK